MMIASAFPPALFALATLLRQDGGAASGRAVLFASVIGFDVVEARKHDLAATSGVALARIEELIAIGRGAHDPASPKIAGQHLISQIILRRFCLPTTQGDRLFAHSLQIGKGKLSATKSVGKLENFVKIDSQATETLWGQTEQYLPAAIDAARTSRIFKNPHHVQVLKDAIALHFARSLEALASTKAIWERGLAEARAAYLSDPEAMADLYYRKHGLHVPPADSVSEQIADDLLEAAETLHRRGIAFRLRVVDLFEQARRLAATAGLQILRPARGEFLIGDVPAVTIDAQRKAIGVREGVAFGSGTTVMLPLSPNRLVALARVNSFERIPKGGVDELNAIQIRQAQKYVYYRPGSHLESFVIGKRPGTKPERP